MEAPLNFLSTVYPFTHTAVLAESDEEAVSAEGGIGRCEGLSM